MPTEVTPDGYVVSVVYPATPELDSLLESLPGFSLLTEPMKNAALAGARMPDLNGVWPGQAEYIDTYDTYFAAMSLIGFLKAQPVVRQTSSEGTSIAVDAPDWDSLVAYYRSMSPIAQATGNGVLQRVLIPEGPHVKRVPMTYGGDTAYGNVDTDLG